MNMIMMYIIHNLFLVTLINVIHICVLGTLQGYRIAHSIVWGNTLFSASLG